MSTPVSSDSDPTQATMYAPPWAREGWAREGAARDGVARDAGHRAVQDALRDAPAAAAENALAASEQLRRVLPPAAQLGERRKRREAPFEGDIAIKDMRERPTLDPSDVPEPPPRERSSSAGVLARVAGAAGLAALAAFFMVGTAPLSLAVKAEGDAAPSLWSRFTGKTARLPANEVASAAPAAPPAVGPLAERFAAVQPAEAAPAPIPTRTVQTVAIQVAPPVPEPRLPAARAAPGRTLDQDEITILYRRSQDLITQGDIAGGRLLLTRAAEGGDARAALALGATYDVAVLGKLAVLGVVADAAKAKAWYAKAAELGSGEAAKRLEVLAHGR